MYKDSKWDRLLDFAATFAPLVIYAGMIGVGVVAALKVANCK